MHLRPAALIVAAIVNCSFIAFFASTKNPTFIATAINIMLVSATILVILQSHYRDFTSLVDAQIRTEVLNNENLRLAHRDSLTNLPTRRQFFATLDYVLAQSLTDGKRRGVGITDLDEFKPINDLYGHAVGDTFLVKVRERLKSLCITNIHLARLGEDEFALILTNVRDDEYLTELCQNIFVDVRKSFVLIDTPVQIAASMGVATFPDMASDAVYIFEYADYTLYHSKRSNRGNLSLFSSHHYEQIHRDAQTEQALRQANVEKEFIVFFQPIVEENTNMTIAFEALDGQVQRLAKFYPASSYLLQNVSAS